MTSGLVLASLVADAALMVLGLVAGVAARMGRRAPVYPLSALVCAVGAAAGLGALLGGEPQTLSLPLGVPWIGAHFRLDPLAGLFLAIVDLGGVASSVYAIGYGRHETSPGRVLPNTNKG